MSIESFLAQANPLVFLFGVLLVSGIAVAAGYLWTHRSARDRSTGDESAFGLGQTAVFGLIALILALSFSFAAERHEARRSLIVQEAVAVNEVAGSAAFLPPDQERSVKRFLRGYVRSRLNAYEGADHITGVSPESERIHAQLWDFIAADVRRDPRNLGVSAEAQAIDHMGDLAQEQIAALDNHVPVPILGIVLFSTVLGSALLGMTFGRVHAPNRALSVMFCLLFAATVYTIVDLDYPQGGFLRLDISPLQDAYSAMK